MFFPRVPCIFCQEPADTKNKNRGKKLEKLLPLYLVRIRITPRALWTTTNTLEAGTAANKRPRQRGTDASHTCVLVRSCRDVRRPRHLPNENTADIFQMRIVQMGPRKNKSRISEIPRPGRYGTNIKLKNRKKNVILHYSTSMPAEYWYVPRVSCMLCRNSIPLA